MMDLRRYNNKIDHNNMIVLNTTFHVEEDIHEEFVAYMFQQFIPMSTKSGLLTSPRLSRVFGREDEPGHSFAMEFKCLIPKCWNDGTGKRVGEFIPRYWRGSKRRWPDFLP